jgi:hypothetical protein
MLGASRVTSTAGTVFNERLRGRYSRIVKLWDGQVYAGKLYDNAPA